MFNIRAMALTSANAHGNRIVGDFVGTDAAGTFAFTTSLRDCSSIELSARRIPEPHRRHRPRRPQRHLRERRSRASTSPTAARTGTSCRTTSSASTRPASARVRNLRMGVDINLGASQNLIGGAGASRAQRALGQRRRRRRGVAHHSTVGNQVVGELHRHRHHRATGVPAYTHNSEQGVHLEDGVQNTLVSGNVIAANLFGRRRRRGHRDRGDADHRQLHRRRARRHGDRQPHRRRSRSVSTPATS